MMLRITTAICMLAATAVAGEVSARPTLLTKSKVLPSQTLAPKAVTPQQAVAVSELRGGMLGSVDWALMACFAGWYLGNYYYTLNNKLALNAAGGATGFPMTIGFCQLLIGSVYALFLWTAPDCRVLPQTSMSDLVKILPVAACAAGAHVSSIFSMNLGAVSFAQIVKAAEPAFAALLGVTIYGKKVSMAKWLCLIPVIGGVCLASLKELDFTIAALAAACIANLFAAFRANENQKLMETEGLKDRIGTVGNQFALSTILGMVSALPFFLFTEAHKFGKFVELFNTVPALRSNLLTSGLYFYWYNELSTLTIKKTSATTQSVANTAKRAIVIIGVALALGESLPFIKLLGCSICIGGVLLYSLAK